MDQGADFWAMVKKEKKIEKKKERYFEGGTKILQKSLFISNSLAKGVFGPRKYLALQSG